MWTKKLKRDELIADFVQSSTPALVVWLQLTESIQRSVVLLEAPSSMKCQDTDIGLITSRKGNRMIILNLRIPKERQQEKKPERTSDPTGFCVLFLQPWFRASLNKADARGLRSEKGLTRLFSSTCSIGASYRTHFFYALFTYYTIEAEFPLNNLTLPTNRL